MPKKIDEVALGYLILAAIACCLSGISPQEAEEKWKLISKLESIMRSSDCA